MTTITGKPKERILSIDILRGIIMVIMALDHVRDYFSNVLFDPLDLAKTTPLLFFTRWITHYCAPTFVFLAGTSAFLSLSKGKTKKEASIFLLKRGLWLVLLEFTIVTFGWFFDIRFHLLLAQVIWAIGISMLVLSMLVFLKPLYVGITGFIIIVVHNAFDHIQAASFEHYRFLWTIVHEQGILNISEKHAVLLFYPIVPWIGVMAIGYAFGTFFLLDSDLRKRWLIRIGLASITAFIILRFLNIYGDPYPWQEQGVWWRNILAFIKCHKYPPSLLYLLMTLGVSITVLAFLENTRSRLSRIFLVYGRVPLFYYILHIYLIHSLQILTAVILGFDINKLLDAGGEATAGWGFGLATVYLVWIIVVAILYLPCRWFMELKQRRSNWWLRYL